MKLNHFLLASRALLKAKILKISTPLAINWVLTTRCNQRCAYCAVCTTNIPEIATQEIISMFHSLKAMGGVYISFSGGEPLLRDDIETILIHAKKLGFYVSLSSNGALIPKNVHKLHMIDKTKLSIDGPSQIHNKQRGEGSFERAMEAIEACRKNNLKFSIDATLTKYSLNSTDYLINMAKKLKTTVMFQPVTSEILWSDKKNNLTPEGSLHKEVMLKLIRQKKNNAPISNSIDGLKYLYHWPKSPEKIYCTAGILSCEILPDGSIISCCRRPGGIDRLKKSNLPIGFKNLKPPANCRQCWCAPLLDFNLLASFNLKAAINALKNL